MQSLISSPGPGSSSSSSSSSYPASTGRATDSASTVVPPMVAANFCSTARGGTGKRSTALGTAAELMNMRLSDTSAQPRSQCTVPFTTRLNSATLSPPSSPPNSPHTSPDGPEAGVIQGATSSDSSPAPQRTCVTGAAPAPPPPPPVAASRVAVPLKAPPPPDAVPARVVPPAVSVVVVTGRVEPSAGSTGAPVAALALAVAELVEVAEVPGRGGAGSSSRGTNRPGTKVAEPSTLPTPMWGERGRDCGGTQAGPIRADKGGMPRASAPAPAPPPAAATLPRGVLLRRQKRGAKVLKPPESQAGKLQCTI